MASAPEKEKPGGHPGIEQQLRKPGEQEKLREQELKVEHILQKVERDHTTTAAITDDTGQPVLQPSQPQDQTVMTLPLTEEEIKHGLHHKIFDSIRWLAQWCLRIARKAALLGIKVLYPQK